MERTTAFQSQLSSIMEKLVVSAVTEINQLVCDYCAVLRVELSREKQHSSALKEELRAAHTAQQEPKLLRPVHDFLPGSQDGNNTTRPQLQSDQLERNTGWRNEDETAEEQEEGTLRLTDCKFEPVTIKHEAAAEQQQELKAALPVHSPTCLQHQVAAEQSSQFCSDPEEDSKDLHTDYKKSVETQCQLSISPSGGHLTDVGCHVKKEAESPVLQTPGEDVDLGFELQQGILYQSYTNCGALPVNSTLPDTPALTCYSSSLPSDKYHILRTLDIPDLFLHGQYSADGDTPSYHGSQLRSGSGSCDTAALFPASRATGQFKYMCDYCGKGFPFLSTMKRHRLSHTGERTQICGQCGKRFIRRSHLRRHELLHSGVRPFTCHICGRKFSRCAHLNTHMKTHSRSVAQLKTSALLRISREISDNEDNTTP